MWENLPQAGISCLIIQCNVSSPETIYTQLTEMDSSDFIHKFICTYSYIFNKEELEGKNFGRNGKRTRKGKVM